MNQTAFQGSGSPILVFTEGPMFEDPFSDGTSFSYAFTYTNRVYLGPNDTNNGAFRFEADGLNPNAVSFTTPGTGCTSTTFGISTGTVCGTDLGPNSEKGIVGFNSGQPLISATSYDILMVGTIKDNVSHFYFTQDIDSQLNWKECSLGSFTGGGNTKSIQSTYSFNADMYAGISSDHGTQAPIMLKLPLSASAGVVSCSTGSDLTLRSLANIGKNAGGSSNPASGIVGIDTMFYNKADTLNPNDTFYVANNGGVVYASSAGTWPPTDKAHFTTALTQANLAAANAGTADDITLVLDSLQKISPGRKGVPAIVKYSGGLYMARNVAVSQSSVANEKTSAGGELWKCTTSPCTSSGNWSRVFTSTTVGGGTGVESTNNKSISMLQVNGSRLYIGFDNYQDGARVYYATAAPTGPGSFTETGRVPNTTVSCSNHTGDQGSFGRQCYAYEILSSASITKNQYNYLYVTVGCQIAGEAVDGGKCDTNGAAGYTAPAMRVLLQRD